MVEGGNQIELDKELAENGRKQLQATLITISKDITCAYKHLPKGGRHMWTVEQCLMLMTVTEM